MTVGTMRQATATGVGLAGFPALLIDQALISRSDLLVAQQHAAREHIEIADALVALGLVSERAAYAALADAAGAELVDLPNITSSELAIRLVPERLARRYNAVPISLDNRTLIYATHHPFDAEAERDLSFASGRRASVRVALRSAVLDALDRCYPKLRELDVLATRLSAERSDVVDLEGHADLAPDA